MDKRKVKRFIGKSVAVLAVAFAILSIVSKRKKRDTVYDNEPEQKNPLEGKKVIFVEDENDKENADGIRGHLEAIGDCDHKPSFYERYIKRGIDIVLSFGGLVVLSPVFAVTALAIKIEDPGPVFFTQKRVGQNKKYFKLHKFRSMKMCTPHDVPTHMLDNPDQYITKVGKFIRAHSLDELPQIWDIFVGNMSVIGPRPGLWNQDLLTAERDKYGANDVKPGLTGWAQINGRDELEIPDKAKLDGEYVRKLGPIMDAKVFLGSLHVFGKDDSVVEGGTGEMKKTPIGDCAYKITVVMPAYNSEKYISASINSVIRQTYRNWELIVIDDCSTDKTRKIVEKICEFDSRIKLYVNNQNLGVAGARNIGIEHATGMYIAFLDSDDLWLPTKLEKQLSFMLQNQYVFSYTNYQKFNSSTRMLGKVIRAPREISADDILGNTIIGCLTVMYDLKMIGKVKMPMVEHMEDNITWHNILIKGYKGYGMNEVLSMYREGNLSLTHSKVKAVKQQWNIYRKYFGFSIVKSSRLFLSYACHALVKHVL